MRVVGYCRVSTLEQSVNGTSTESQVISIKNECRKLNYQLIDIYIDDGVSGKGNDRPELNRLRGDAKSNKFDCVMLTKLDRLGRNNRDLSNIAHEFSDTKTKLHFIDEPYIDGSGLMFNIFATFAEFERDTIRARTELGRKAVWLKQTSVIGSLPFGYKKVNGKPEIDEKKAKIYNRIVSMYLDQNYSMKEIAVKLTLEGIPTPKRSLKKTHHNWSTPTISDILKNEAYTGEKLHNRFVYETRKSAKSGKSYSAPSKIENEPNQFIKVLYPPLISEEKFQLIQKRIQLQKRKPRKHHSGGKEHFLGENILYCGHCGTKMKKIRIREGKFKYVCYWSYCSQKELFLNNKEKCILKPIVVEDADNRIFTEVSEIISDPGSFAKEWLRNTNIDEITDKLNRLESIERKIKDDLINGFRISQSAENPEIRKIYEDELKKKEIEYTDIKSSKNRAKKELDFAESKVNYLAKFHESLKSATNREKFGIYFSTKAKFKTFLSNLPTQEKKRIVGAVVSPEDGGKYFVRHPTLDDIADETDGISASELYNPLTKKGHVLDGVYSIDLGRIEAIIGSLNYSELLGSVVCQPIPATEEKISIIRCYFFKLEYLVVLSRLGKFDVRPLLHNITQAPLTRGEVT